MKCSWENEANALQRRANSACRDLPSYSRASTCDMKFALGAGLLLSATAVLAERFDERLALKVLPNRKVLAHWTFTTSDADLRQRAQALNLP